jgi:hypothetical protein
MNTTWRSTLIAQSSPPILLKTPNPFMTGFSADPKELALFNYLGFAMQSQLDKFPTLFLKRIVFPGHIAPKVSPMC